MKQCVRCAWVCLFVFTFALFGFDRISGKAFAEDIVQIAATIFPVGQTGIYYSAPVVAGDGAAPFQFYIVSGNLPSGLSLNSETGAISGTPSSAGTFSFTAGMKDAEGFSTSANLSIVIDSGAPIRPTYGAGVGGDGLCNTAVGPSQRMASFRFTATHSGALEQATVYLIPDKSGYAGGTGGTIEVSLKTDDGTSAHNPSSTTLATYYISGAASLPSPQRYFYKMKFSNSPSLETGKMYHLVFQNVGDDPQDNFISVDTLYESTAQSSMPPAPSDPNAAVLMSQVGGPWTPRPGFAPIYELDYQDGASQGIGYVAAWVGDQQNISGTSTIRESFTVTGSQIKVTSAAIRLSRIHGSDPVRIQLQNSVGTAIEDGYVETSNIPLSSASSPVNGWATLYFPSALTLVPGQTYHLLFECTATSTYQAFPLQKGGYYGFRTTTFFPDGHAEVKVDGSWTGWSEWGTANRIDDDLQFYLAVAQ